MSNTRQLADSTNFLGTLESAIRAEDEVKSREDFKAIVRSQTVADRAADRLTEQGLEVGGILALLLSKGRIANAEPARTSRGWSLRTLLNLKNETTPALHVTSEGILLVHEKSHKTTLAAAALVVALGVIGFFASGGASIALVATCATIWVLLAIGVASFVVVNELAREDENPLFLLLGVAVAILCLSGIFHLFPGHGMERPLFGSLMTMTSGVIAGFKAPPFFARFFGWRTAIAGADFNDQTIAVMTRLVKPEIEKLGQSLPASLSPGDNASASLAAVQA